MKNLKEFPKIIKYPDPETGEKVWAVQSANFIDIAGSFYIACKLWLWNMGIPAKWLFDTKSTLYKLFFYEKNK